MELLSKTGVLVEDLFGIEGFDVYWYGFLITCAFLLAFFVVSFFANRRGHYKDLTLDMLIVTVVGAIVGARLYYVIFEWKSYYVEGNLLATLSNVVDIRKGGLAIYGGIILCVIGLTVFAFVKKIKPIQLLDLCAPALALGQAIGRWGNFMNREAFGAETTLPWRMELHTAAGNVMYVHPTFLYESLWNFCGVILLLWLSKHKKQDGEVCFTYFIWYGIGRFFIEGLRADSLYWGPFRISQVVGLLTAVAGMILLFNLKRKGKKMLP